jgi:polar amino acid transport system substrate-binding protein
MNAEIIRQLAPKGVLRAGINLSNFLLVTGRGETGDPVGVAPDMARAIAEKLGVGVRYVPFATPGELADALEHDAWDIGLIGAEPARAEKIAFSSAYVEIEATYLVRADSGLREAAEADRAGVRIAAKSRAAYELWLARNLRQATLVATETHEEALAQLASGTVDALAGLRTGLIGDAQTLPGARVLEGKFTAVQQAVGTARKNAAAAEFLRGFVEEAKASGLVAKLIARHGVRGLTVAALG